MLGSAFVVLPLGIMKNIKIFIFFLIGSISFSQSNEFLDFYPLSVGNQWTMLSQFDVPPYEEHYFVSVEKDTLINDKIYFKIKTEYPFSNSKYYSFERIDTLTSQVIRYDKYYSIDYIIDSLEAEGEDWFTAERYHSTYPFNNPTQCYWVKTDTILNIQTVIKAFQGINNDWWPPAYILAKGFGVVEILGTQWRTELVYAKIDGIEYGTPVGNIKEESSLPKEFLLTQNYPNPFNPSTTIKYQIPELSFVTVKVYDVLGSEVATLINEEKPIGSYEIEFDATTLPSSIYFYRLQAGAFVETKKMVLMK